MDILNELAIAMRLRAIKQEVISSNIANINTPNYRCKNLDFQKEINKILTHKTELKLETTNPRHIPYPKTSNSEKISPEITECKTTVIGNDKNNVDLDKEMEELAKNHLLYNSYVQLFAKKLKMLKDAIIQGGR